MLKFHVYLDGLHEYRWQLKASNGKALAESSEGYEKRSHCVRMIRKIVQSCMAEEVEMVDDTVKAA